MVVLSPTPLTELASAKVNLTLRVLGRRADGYHELESLVVFADVGDDLAFTPADTLDLTVRGVNAASAGPLADNLVVKAARRLACDIAGLKLGHFALTKRLPVAAGWGGGPAPPAAALRLLARANGLSPGDPRLMAAARATGADVPVCLDPHPRLMRGIGEVLSAPLSLPRLQAVLVNPGVALATKDVFAALGAQGMREPVPASAEERFDALALIAAGTNDLEPPAIVLRPVIGDVLAALRAVHGCRLARMSGSGATCFGLFGSKRAAANAARSLKAAHPDWWVRATSLG
jgi:4-diphosphocytidyl-2-C-methyl-D-erythritol kinase